MAKATHPFLRTEFVDELAQLVVLLDRPRTLGRFGFREVLVALLYASEGGHQRAISSASPLTLHRDEKDGAAEMRFESLKL